MHKYLLLLLHAQSSAEHQPQQYELQQVGEQLPSTQALPSEQAIENIMAFACSYKSKK